MGQSKRARTKRGGRPTVDGNQSVEARLARIRNRLQAAPRPTPETVVELQRQAAELQTDPERFKPLLAKLNRRGLNLPCELTAEEGSIVADALYLALAHRELDAQVRGLSLRHFHALQALTDHLPGNPPRAERCCVAINRLQGLPDTAQHRLRIDKAALKQDWDDLTGGGENPRYPNRVWCGLPLLDDQKCFAHFDGKRNVWHGWCPTCQAQFAPVGKLDPHEALTAIQRAHGLRTEGAAYKALQRAGAKGLPATWATV